MRLFPILSAISAIGLLTGALAAEAATPLATTVSYVGPVGSYGGSLSVLNDGVYPANGQQYQTDTVYDFPNDHAAYFNFDLGGAKTVGAFNITVDNNDDYDIVFI